jgi:hypothetical protein
VVDKHIVGEDWQQAPIDRLRVNPVVREGLYSRNSCPSKIIRIPGAVIASAAASVDL